MRALAILLFTMCIQGCGNKGPLYLPSSKPATAKKPAAPPPAPPTVERPAPSEAAPDPK